MIKGLIPPVNVALTQYKKGVRAAASKVAKTKPELSGLGKEKKVAGWFGGKSRAQKLYDEAVKGQTEITPEDRKRLKKERKGIMRPNRIVPLKGLDEPYQRLMVAQNLNKKGNII